MSMKLLEYHWELCSYSCVPIIMEAIFKLVSYSFNFVLDLLDSKWKL